MRQQDPQCPAPYPGEVQGHCTPTHTPFSLEKRRSLELNRFYQLTQQQREFYKDKTGTLHPIPYFLLPEVEREKNPHPLDLSLPQMLPSCPRCRTVPSGKRVTSQEREVCDNSFEYRA
ncbi:CB070 protein, partial [Odontophorus gujanensis]|nr:CB070 protein [Odontophorus gujanensis]